jgi:hypothetical protein
MISRHRGGYSSAGRPVLPKSGWISVSMPTGPAGWVSGISLLAC